jgi:hypothetical protein
VVEGAGVDASADLSRSGLEEAFQRWKTDSEEGHRKRVPVPAQACTTKRACSPVSLSRMTASTAEKWAAARRRAKGADQSFCAASSARHHLLDG